MASMAHETDLAGSVEPNTSATSVLRNNDQVFNKGEDGDVRASDGDAYLKVGYCTVGKGQWRQSTYSLESTRLV